MIVDMLEAFDLLVNALAVWIGIGAVLATPALLATVWAACALWRRLTGARRPAGGPEAGMCHRCARNAPQGPYSESSYQEAA